MTETYARILINEFEEMKGLYNYKQFISDINAGNTKKHYLENFIDNLEYDLNKLLESDGDYTSKVDEKDFGNKREYQVTLLLLRRFTSKLTSEYRLQEIS